MLCYYRNSSADDIFAITTCSMHTLKCDYSLGSYCVWYLPYVWSGGVMVRALDARLKKVADFSSKCFWTCPPHLKNVATVPCEMKNSCIWYNVHFFPQNWMVLKQPVVLSHGNLNFRQATSQQLLKLTIFVLIYASSYFYNQSLELSTTLYGNSAHYDVAESGVGCVHRSWLTYMWRFLVATAVYIR